MIIDAHTHVFPPDVIERRELFAKRDSSFGFIYGNPDARMVTCEGLIEEMDLAGVDVAIVCGFPWKSLDLCRNHNDYMMEAMKKYPGRLVGLATINPVAGKACDRELGRCFSGGLKGVGELSADAQGFQLDHTSTTGRIVHAVNEADLFMVLHVNEDVGHFYPGKTATTPGSVYRFLEKFPEVTVVLAHWGGGFFFYELMPEIAKMSGRVYYDTAASPFLYKPTVYKTALEIIGSGRILFGTDYPLLRMGRHLEEIEVSGIGDNARRKMLSGNARKLLGIKAK